MNWWPFGNRTPSVPPPTWQIGPSREEYNTLLENAKRAHVRREEAQEALAEAMRERDEAVLGAAAARHNSRLILDAKNHFADRVKEAEAALAVEVTCNARLKAENAELRAQVRSMRTRLGNQTKKLRRSA